MRRFVIKCQPCAGNISDIIRLFVKQMLSSDTQPGTDFWAGDIIYCLHFIHEETEAQRHSVTHLMSHIF